MPRLFTLAHECLLERDMEVKIRLSKEIVEGYEQGLLDISRLAEPVKAVEAGLPENLKLVPARQLSKRSFSTERGKAAMLHALSHIEFNAINIAWDAIYRFQDMPEAYYQDWIKVAGEETEHFILLRQHLIERGYDYGDFEAHDGLWRMVMKTAADPLVRMAIVPRVYEARGLDVTPDIISKFEAIGEKSICQTLNLIYEDEIGHVSIGNRWFRYLCKRRNLEPLNTFIELVEEYMDSVPRIKLNREARRLAGFSEAELASLEQKFT